ncbi:cytosolic phospholipase A2, partial [Elysia marginata]
TFGSIFDLHPTNVKKLYVVDSGLTFNSPFPVVLRPQREVDIILSFDFSARPSDDTPPFKELLLAAKWAELNKVPFPPIDPNIVEKEGLKECYVFKHPWDPNCPIVLHFCLVNVNFRREISPGVPRTTQEEIDFGNFAIFDDPAHPYSTFKFTYTHQEFERLSRLMEYNTLLCSELIFDNISTCVKRRRRFSIRRPCTKKDIARLSLNSRAKVKELENYISMVEKVTEASQQEETSSPSPSSSSNLLSNTLSSPGSSLGKAYSKPVLNGGAGGRRGSKEEADVSNKPRPVSSPVRFLKELEEERKNLEKPGEDSGSDGGNDDVILNPRLHRSAFSLKTKKEVRARLSSAMSKVIEEGDDDDEPDTPNPILIDKATPSRGVLSRSRPVSASMKPTINTERKISAQEHDPVAISTNATNTNGHLSHSNNSGSNSIHPNSASTRSAASPRLNRGSNILTASQGRENGQTSEDKTGPASAANKLLAVSISDEHSGDLCKVKDTGSISPALDIEHLIDTAERVTDL